MRAQLLAGFLSLGIMVIQSANAGEADVIDATAERGTGGLWRFSATVAHADEGWSHYANKFEVVDMNGKVLAVRVLAHPHENEQPFTRSLDGVEIPEDMEKVLIRAGDSVHELGGRELVLTLPR